MMNLFYIHVVSLALLLLLLLSLSDLGLLGDRELGGAQLLRRLGSRRLHLGRVGEV